MATNIGKGNTNDRQPRLFVQEMLPGIQSTASLTSRTQSIRSTDPADPTLQPQEDRTTMRQAYLFSALTEACRGLIDEDDDDESPEIGS